MACGFPQKRFQSVLKTRADYERKLQLNLYCDERKRGTLFLSIEIEGPTEKIREVVTSASLKASPVEYANVPFRIEDAGDGFTQAVIEIPRNDVMAFLTKADTLSYHLSLKSPYQPIWATTQLKGSRKALIFAANNCVH